MRTRDVLLALFIATAPLASAQEDVPEVARQALSDANSLRDDERFEDAIARYREVMAMAPSLLDVYVGLGACYHQTNRYEEALSVFSAGLERFPDDPTLLFNAAATNLRLERLDDALGYADRALRVSGDDTALNAMRGAVLRRLGRVDEAIGALEKVVSLDGKNARAHYNLGNAQYEAGRKNEALESYRQAVKLDKNLGPAHYNMGAVLFELDRFDEALEAYEVALRPIDEDFEKGREVSPSHARAYLNLGAIYLKRKSYDRALDAYGKAVRLEPNQAAAHYNIGYIYYVLGQKDEAYAAYQQVVKLDPELPLSYLHMGLIDFERGRMEQTVGWLEPMLERFALEDRPQATLALAQAQQALGKAQQAEAAYRQAIQLRPDSVEALVGLGRVLREQGRLEEARPLLERAGDAVLDSSGVAIELAALARAEGDISRERALYEEALVRDGSRPELWPVRANLVGVLIRTGAIVEAMREMESLLEQLGAVRDVPPSVAAQLRTANAMLLARTGDLARARRELDAVLAGDNGFAPALNGKAVLAAIAGDLAGASTVWSRLVSTGDATLDGIVRANLGQALWLMERYDDAEPHLVAAREVYPDNPMLRAALGEIALMRGHYVQAEPELRAALAGCRDSGSTADGDASAASSPGVAQFLIAGAPEDDAACARIRRALGMALVASASARFSDRRAGSEVRALVDEAIGLGVSGGTVSRALFMRGTFELQAQQNEAARQSLERAISGSLPPALAAAAHNNLGVALHRTGGSAAEVQRHFEQARARAGGMAPATLNLAITLHEAKQSQRALSLYDEYVALGGERRNEALEWAESIRKIYR